MTLTNAATANTAGMTVKWLPTAANTAADPTLAVSGLSAATIKKCGNVPLIANDLLTTTVAIAIFDGTNFQLLNPQTVTCGIPTSGVYAVQNANSGATGVGALTANASKLWSYVAPATCIGCTKVVYSVNTADNSANLYNIALFNTDGTIACQTGATAGSTLFPAAGFRTANWTAACNIIGNKRYYIGWTAVTATAQIGGSTTRLDAVCNTAPTSNATTSGAVWTTPIGIPADSYVTNCTEPTFGFAQ